MKVLSVLIWWALVLPPAFASWASNSKASCDRILARGENRPSLTTPTFKSLADQISDFAMQVRTQLGKKPLPEIVVTDSLALKTLQSLRNWIDLQATQIRAKEDRESRILLSWSKRFVKYIQSKIDRYPKDGISYIDLIKISRLGANTLTFLAKDPQENSHQVLFDYLRNYEPISRERFGLKGLLTEDLINWLELGPEMALENDVMFTMDFAVIVSEKKGSSGNFSGYRLVKISSKEIAPDFGELSNKAVDHVVFVPLFANISIATLNWIQSHLVAVLGLTAQVKSVDGDQLDPLEFWEHDYDHVLLAYGGSFKVDGREALKKQALNKKKFEQWKNAALLSRHEMDLLDMIWFYLQHELGLLMGKAELAEELGVGTTPIGDELKYTLSGLKERLSDVNDLGKKFGGSVSKREWDKLIKLFTKFINDEIR